LPVRVDAPHGAKAAAAAAAQGPDAVPARVHVQVAGQDVAKSLGVAGVVLTVARGDGAAVPGAVSVAVDYSGFAKAFGDYADRVRLVALPACALRTPDVAACRVQSPVASVNDHTAESVSADVTLPAAEATAASPALVLAATASSDGSAGTYSATPLKGSDSWSAGGSSGSFGYRYPIQVPATLGGSAPDVELSYESGAIDGETASTNAQTSWIGDGWDYSPGFIERTYKPCSKDGIQYSGDLCWPGADTTLSLSLAGHSGALVRNDATGALKLSSDDGSTITKLSNAANGTGNNEAFLVTTTDGTKYYFGLGHLPGGTNADAATNSVFTQPVYAPHSGDPCYSSSAGTNSWCQMGWRFNLDAVVDPHGNLTQYTYSTETNYYDRGYGQTNGNGTLTQYVRGGVLNTISYGWLASEAVAGAKPAAQVLFTPAERCTASAATCQYSNLNSTTASNWPDTPYDQNCGSTGACSLYSPSYWSTKMLAGISTQVLVGSSYRKVDSYTLNHQFPDNGDGTAPNLWLASIARSGTDGQSAVSVPNLVFYGVMMANRAPGALLNGATLPQMFHWRLQTIDDETGMAVTVKYSDPACSQSNPVNLPASQDANTMLCFPQYWSPVGSGQSGPIKDWFEKYVVSSVSSVDRVVTTTPARVTNYTYVGAPAWHSDDGELTDPTQRTWAQWRGYGKVITTVGGAPDPVSQTQTTFFRGMNGDIDASGSVRSVSLTDSQGGTHPDDEVLSGSVLETQTFTSAGGSVQSDVITTPVQTTTATHTRVSPLPKQYAVMTATARTVTRDLLANGSWRTHEVDNSYDPAHANRLTESDDKGTGEASVPELCTDTSYAGSAVNPQMLTYASEVRTIAGACGTAPTTADTVSDKITLYDGNTSAGSLDNAGTASAEATGQQVLDHYDGSTPVYATVSTSSFDRYGRILTATDPNATDAAHPGGAVTSTVYTPASGAIPTQSQTTNPLGFVTTTTFDPGRSLPTHVVDPNNKVTDVTYDALGRTTQVWLPIRSKASYPSTPSMKFSYAVNGGSAPSYTETQALRDDGVTYSVSYSILNGFAEQRQTQEDAQDASGGRVITDTYYNTGGKVAKTSSSYFNADAPSATVFATNDNTVPQQIVTGYDGRGRVTNTTTYSYANPQWSTATAYPGADRTDVTPPTGSAPSSTFTDGRGHTVATWRYKTATPTGDAGDADKVTYSYTPAGQQASVTDATGATTWSYGYDLRGRKTTSQDPDTGTTTTGYDADSRIATTTDARGKQLTYSYDLLGRRTAEYDTTGNAAPAPADELAAWTFDTLAKGRPTASIRYVGGAGGSAYTTATTGYTADYKPTGTSITIPPTEGALAGTYTSTMRYTANTELLSQVGLPAAGNLYADTLAYTYQPFGLLRSIAGLGDYLTSMSYNPWGKPVRTTLGDMPLQAVQTIGYDGATTRPTWVTVDKENGTDHVDQSTYTYGLDGQITAVADQQDGGATDQQCYSYDYAGRLAGAWTDTGGVTTAPSPSVPNVGACTDAQPTAASAATQIGGPAAYWQSYGYDVAGDRTAETDHNTAGTTAGDVNRGYHYPAPGAATQPHTLSATTVSGSATGDTFTYDQAGNTLTRQLATGANQSLKWDSEGHLASVTDKTSNKTSSYLYDAAGALLIQRDPTETVLYLDRQEIHLKGTTATGIRTISAPGGPSIQVTAGAVAFSFANLQATADTTVAAKDLTVTRRYFDPYGRPRGIAPAAWPDERAFLDKPADPSTGLDMIGARAYDSGSGRFVSADPVFETGDQDQMGGYAYGADDPVDTADPTGLMVVAGGNDGDESFAELQQIEAEVDALLNPKPAPAPKHHNRGLFGTVWHATSSAVSAGAHAAASGADFVYHASGASDVVDCATDPSWGGCSSAAFTVLTTVGTGGEAAVGRIAVEGLAKDALENGAKDLAENGAKDAAESGAKDAAANTAEDAASCTEPHSFTAVTPILMGDGTSKPISQVQVGDTVANADPATGTQQQHRVDAIIVTQTDHDFTDVTVDTPTGDRTIHTTDHHPFYSVTKGTFVEAADLRPGDTLKTPDGTVAVTAVRRFHTTQTTYDLTIDGLHTYYVEAGDTAVLVHNSVCPTIIGQTIDGRPIRAHSPNDSECQCQAFQSGARFVVDRGGDATELISPDDLRLADPLAEPPAGPVEIPESRLATTVNALSKILDHTLGDFEVGHHPDGPR
ncbi:MAG: hypothetical protein HOW97_21795, partial [Catenulispora sp.]|nr:hypothetical protein [Catenulispora sp.]